MDAINEVLKITQEATACSHKHPGLCAIIRLDAFNNAPRQLNLEELRKREFDESLVRLIAFYLTGRYTISSRGKIKNNKDQQWCSAGACLGPTRKNVFYDELLDMDIPASITLIGIITDDKGMVVILVTAKHEKILMESANKAFEQGANWMQPE